MAISKKMLEGLAKGEIKADEVVSTVSKDDTTMSVGPQDKVGADITKDLKVPEGVKVRHPLKTVAGTEVVPNNQGSPSIIQEGVGQKIKLVLPKKLETITGSKE